MECDLCARAFAPVRSAWPDRCGDCIAAEIELMLLRSLLAEGDRKPLRRTVAVTVTPVAASDTAGDARSRPDAPAEPRRQA